MRYEIRSERTGELVARDAYLADSPWSRMKGLLGKEGLEPGEAIILRPASSIHMLFMRFAIDVIYLNKQDEVVKLVRNLAPWRFSAARGAHSVIELAAGGLAGVALQPGDRLLLSPLAGVSRRAA
jgi:hypothetical protein